jgi:exopolyphosphatase/guanosine-5'-triphosphate,3'-diphosphate pyrophosphatase
MSQTSAVAAIDCGTNSTRLLVVRESGAVAAREMRITRLGADVDATLQLQPDAVARTLEVLTEYRAIMDEERTGRARLVATSAVRDAANRDAFLAPASDVVGVPVEVLTGVEEGRLSYAGATAELPVIDGRTVVIDIGGGSTEIVTMAEGDLFAVSLDIGCVRLTERFLRNDPPTAAQVADAESAIAEELERAERALPALGRRGPTDRLVGLAGTVSTLAALELDLSHYERDRIHHAVLSYEAVEKWCDVLAAEPVQDRAVRPSIIAGREDVLFGGALVLRECMAHFGFMRCIVSEADMLDGLVASLRDSTSGSPERREV